MITPPSARAHFPLGPVTGADATDSSATADHAPPTTDHARRHLGLAASGLAVLVLMIGLFAGLAPAASAAGATVNQCNNVYDGGGQEVECSVVINNVINLATGVSSSSGTIKECHGAAGAAPLCTTTPVTSLSTTVNQCNYSGNGGGSTMVCTVQVTNTITGSGTKTPVTVNQCNGSGSEGPEPTTNCTPKANTTNADITQCNGSANGGGAQRRVTCTVTPSTSTTAQPIKINQCNNSVNGGGSTVTCSTSIVNIFKPVTTTTPTSTTATTGPTSTTTGPTGPVSTATSTRTRPSGTVRPTIATRPTTAGSATTGSGTGSGVTASARTTTAGNGDTTNTARSTTSANGVGTGTTSGSNTTTTGLPNTGAPAGREALLAVMLLALGAGFMVMGRRPRWVGKHR